jgi:hypothetical protein
VPKDLISLTLKLVTATNRFLQFVDQRHSWQKSYQQKKTVIITARPDERTKITPSDFNAKDKIDPNLKGQLGLVICLALLIS